MKIVIFYDAYTPYFNGTISNICDLSNSLKALGHDVMIVAPNPRADKLIKKENILLCPARRYGNQFGFTYKKIKSKGSARNELLMYIENFDPDIIDVNAASPMGIEGFDIAVELETPLVFTINDRYKNESLGKFYNAKSKSYFKSISRDADLLISHSPVAHRYIDKFKIKNSVNVLIPAVNTESFDGNKVLPVNIMKLKEKYSLRNCSLVALFAGFLTPDKNLESLIKNFKKIVIENKNIKLFIVGDGPCKKKLEGFVTDLGIASNVVFTGYVKRNNMQNYYALADIFVSASVCDLFSTSVAEANCCGVPAIIPLLAPNILQIEEGTNGFTYKDDRDFINYIRRFNSLDSDARKILKKLVRRFSVKNSSLEYTKSIIKLYNEAIKIHMPQPSDCSTDSAENNFTDISCDKK